MPVKIKSGKPPVSRLNPTHVKERLFYFALLTPAIVLCVAFIIIPIVDSVAMSFTDYKIANLTQNIPGKWNDFGNYVRLWDDMLEAATMDGAGRLSTLFRVIIPLVVPGILAVGVYSFLMTWDDYLHAVTLIRSNDLWTLSQGLKLTYMGEVSDWQMLNSASTLGAIPMVFVFFFFPKYMIKGLVAGAVKG